MKITDTFYGYKTTRLICTIALFAAMESTNIILAGSPMNLLLTGLQLCVVVGLLLKQDYRKAFLFHMIFIALSFDATSMLTEDALFSYGKIKLIGPISFVHVIMGIFFIVVRSKYAIDCKDSMIYKAYKLLLLLFYLGIGVGIIGFIFDSNYSFRGFIAPFVYMTTGLVHLNILLRLYDSNYTKSFFVTAWMLLVSSAIATTVTYTLGYTAEYSVESVYLYNEFYILTPCLLIATLQFNNKSIVLISLVGLGLFIYNAITSGARGMTFMTAFASILMYIYVLYTKKQTKPFEKTLRIVLPYFIFIGLPGLIIFLQNTDGLSAHKFKEFLSLFSLFDFSTDLFTRLSYISTSPYIRIAEVIDIVDNYFHDFISLPLGRGYGGYYTDSLNLFAGIDLTQGGFPAEVVASGNFPTAHSVFPSALLYNGFIGLFLVLKLGFTYIKKVKLSFLCYAGFILFCYSLYFNPLIFLASIFCLYGAEFQLAGTNKQIV